MLREQQPVVGPTLRARRGAPPQIPASATQDVEFVAMLGRRHRRRLEWDIGANLQYGWSDEGFSDDGRRLRTAAAGGRCGQHKGRPAYFRYETPIHARFQFTSRTSTVLV